MASFEAAQLMVSRGTAGKAGGKSKQLAATPALRAAIRGPMRRLGIAVVNAASNFLGFTMGATARGPNMKARNQLLAWRIQRLKQMRAEGRKMKKGIAKVLFIKGSSQLSPMGSRAWASPLLD